MAMRRKLNLDIPTAVNDLESLIKKFLIKKEIYRRVFRGKGLEFDGYKDYSPDDDSSLIDWKASLRASKLVERQYIEERDIKVMIFVDVSKNMLTGSAKKIKCEYAAEVAASLSHLILSSGDEVGFCFFNNHILKFVPPKKGISQFFLFSDFLSNPNLYGGYSDVGSSLNMAVNYLEDSITVAVLISDFINVKKGFQKILNLFSKKIETFAIVIRDPLDLTLPDLNREVCIEDPKTGEQRIINPKIARKIYERNALLQLQNLRNFFEDSDVDYVELNSSSYFVLPVVQFLLARAEKRRPVISA